MDRFCDNGEASSAGFAPPMLRATLSSRCSNAAQKWVTLGVFRVWRAGIGVSGLGLTMGGWSTSDDSEIVTLFGVCGLAGNLGVAPSGFGLKIVAFDLEIGSFTLLGLEVGVRELFEGSDATAVQC
jgi:hypothetical protein